MGAAAVLKHADVTEKIIGVFYDVYNELGYGFLECVYEESLVAALADLFDYLVRASILAVVQS